MAIPFASYRFHMPTKGCLKFSTRPLIKRGRKQMHREFIFIVGYNFGTSVSLSLLSLYLSLSLSVSLHLSPTNCPIYQSLSYPPHRSNSLKWKERKGGERRRDREIDGGVIGWEKEGDWKREREREGGVKQMCQNCILQWIWALCDRYLSWHNLIKQLNL